MTNETGLRQSLRLFFENIDAGLPPGIEQLRADYRAALASEEPGPGRGPGRDAAWWLEYAAVGIDSFIQDNPPGQNIYLDGKNAGLRLAAASVRAELVP